MYIVHYTVYTVYRTAYSTIYICIIMNKNTLATLSNVGVWIGLVTALASGCVVYFIYLNFIADWQALSDRARMLAGFEVEKDLDSDQDLNQDIDNAAQSSVDEYSRLY